MDSRQRIELLAPAKNADIAIEAIRHGADAVYIGATSHGARAAAGNSVADIARVVDYAHTFHARVYVTLNTLVYNDELRRVEQLIRELFRIGVDALIVQDLGILRLDIPPIALHASTQCDIRTPEKAHFLEQLGFSQLVLPRELTLDETRAIHEAVRVPLEAFVHGALCVSYSGDCQAGYATMGRSANRGCCPQICRLPYSLVDGDGQTLVRNKHLLSLKDLNRSALLAEMFDAGVSSLKIEGRLKDAAYVKTTVAAYRQLIDSIISSKPERYVRSSIGSSKVSFTPDLSAAFNRGFTSYFTRPVGRTEKMASVDTPKWAGIPVGTVVQCNPKFITARLTTPLVNGDGLGYFDADGNFCGFRVNRVERNRIFPAKPVDMPRDTTLYRNFDKEFDKVINASTARRTVEVDMSLRNTPSGVALEITHGESIRYTYHSVIPFAEANKPQEQLIRDELSRLGNTSLSPRSITVDVGRRFIAKSELSKLRRAAVDGFERTLRLTHPTELRRPEDAEARFPAAELTYHDNVANDLAAAVYSDHGATVGQRALEVEPRRGRIPVMSTRYCLRREFGRCLKTPAGRLWKEPLTLVADGFTLDVKFDCARCGMTLLTTPRPTPK